VAVIALFAAIAGTAIAGSSAKKVTTKKVKKIADNEIKKLAPGLSVAHANGADDATNATSADHATSANSAQSANSADSVGGVSIEPVSIALPDPASQQPTPIAVNGSLVRVTCGSGSVDVEIDRDSGSPPITGQWVRNGLAPAVVHEPPSGGGF